MESKDNAAIKCRVKVMWFPFFRVKSCGSFSFTKIGETLPKFCEPCHLTVFTFCILRSRLAHRHQLLTNAKAALYTVHKILIKSFESSSLKQRDCGRLVLHTAVALSHIQVRSVVIVLYNIHTSIVIIFSHYHLERGAMPPTLNCS
jgi:hypothetical protein